MKTRLHVLTRWMVTMLLCTLSLTAFADEDDFTGTTVEFSSNEIGQNPSGTYSFVGMTNGKPSYSTEITNQWNETITFTIRWKLSTMATNGDAWVIEYPSMMGNQEVTYNIQPTDSVPMHGWMTNGDNPISTNLTGCVEDNIIVDPLSGIVITIAGFSDLAGDFVYTGSEGGKPCFVDSLATAGVTKICYYNWLWSIMVGTDSVLFTNNYSDGKLVPENNWVASEGVVSDYITLSSIEDVTADCFEGITIDVAGTELEGRYVYVQVLNSNPVYRFSATDDVSYFLLKNDSAWVIQEGFQNLLPLSTAPILTYSKRDAGENIPQNGWTAIGDATPVLTSEHYGKVEFVATGEVITLSGSDFDTELLYNGDGAYNHSFIGTYNGADVKVTKISNDWAVQYGDSVYFNSEAYINDGYVPDFGWIDANGDYSALTIAGVMTGSEFDGTTVEVDGEEFFFNGIVNNRISFSDSIQILKCVAGVWGIYADVDATNATATSTKTTDFFVPQNGWSNDLTVSGYNVTKYVYDGDVITASNTLSNADGVYVFDALVGSNSWNMYATYIKVEGTDTFRISYTNNQWELSVDDSTLFYTEQTLNINNNKVIPQNTWSSMTDNTSFLYLSGDFTADVYVGKSLSMGDETLDYNGMIENRFSFGSDATTLVQYNGATWEIVSNGAIIYTNDIVGATIPSNMWVSVATGTINESLILFDYNYTTYYYQDVVISGMDSVEANGTYTIVDNGAYYVQFIKVINDSTSATINVSWNGISIKLGNTLLCENEYALKNSANKTLIPQNLWTVQGETNTSIVASGLSTKFINLVTVSGTVSEGGYVEANGVYSGLNNNSYVLDLHMDEVPYWSYYNQYSDAGDISINYNVDGTLVPQNNWLTDGVLDSAFAVAGDSTFVTSDLNLPVPYVTLTGSDFDGKYTYSDNGVYVSEFADTVNTFVLNKINTDSAYWAFTSLNSQTGVVTVSINYNVDGTLIPQKYWLTGGNLDYNFSVEGDSTFMTARANDPSLYVYLTGSDYDSSYYYYSVGSYYTEFDGKEVIFELNKRLSYWKLYVSDGYGSSSSDDLDSVITPDYIAINYNINGRLLPSNNWIVDGELDSLFVVTGDSTFVTTSANIPSTVELTGSDYDGTYAYSSGAYYTTIELSNYLIELKDGDTPYWALFYAYSADVDIAVNYNIEGTLIPQNKWMIDGVIDSLFTLSGDSTFFVQEPAYLVDAKAIEFSVYPNPSQSEVNIDVAAAGSVTVYSLTGAVVMTSPLQKGHNLLSISSLNQGAYLFVTSIEGKREVARLIKE